MSKVCLELKKQQEAISKIARGHINIFFTLQRFFKNFFAR